MPAGRAPSRASFLFNLRVNKALTERLKATGDVRLADYKLTVGYDGRYAVPDGYAGVSPRQVEALAGHLVDSRPEQVRPFLNPLDGVRWSRRSWVFGPGRAWCQMEVGGLFEAGERFDGWGPPPAWTDAEIEDRITRLLLRIRQTGDLAGRAHRFLMDVLAGKETDPTLDTGGQARVLFVGRDRHPRIGAVLIGPRGEDADTKLLEAFAADPQLIRPGELAAASGLTVIDHRSFTIGDARKGRTTHTE